jgi:hypothetical protein
MKDSDPGNLNVTYLSGSGTLCIICTFYNSF